MRAAHTVEQVRAAEHALLETLPEGALMQRAAHGLAVAIADFLGSVYGHRVLLVVGSGDNGGDALYAGALLARRGAAVEAILVSERVHEAGLAELRARGGLVVSAEEAHRPAVLVDGVVGIGGRPSLKEPVVAVLARFAGVPVVAVDVPSGVDVDTGLVGNFHVEADLTVTFGTHKVCHLVDPAALACGVVQLVDIGLSLPDAAVTALQGADVAALLPRPGGFDHKYTRGVVGVAAGSALYPGAAVLCTSGAFCGLAGMVRYVGAAADQVRARHPGIVVGEGRVQAWVVGSGSGDHAREALERVQAEEVALVVDADGLRHWQELPTRRTESPNSTHRKSQLDILTPHAGELAAMLDIPREQVEERMLEHARLAAERFGAVVLLKGRHTLIAHPDGRVRVTTTGTPWLAVAGAGDVLAGLIGALLAAGLAPFDAASVGSWLHGAAATYASKGGPLTPEAVADALPRVIRDLR